MAHYAFLDENNVVVQVITGRDEDDLAPGVNDWETYYSTKRTGLTCKRTSFNTKAGEHLLGGEPFRGNYAGIGYTYLEAEDIFMPPKPYESWVLNIECACWEAPVPMPQDGEVYIWDETAGEWVVSD